MDTSSDYRIKIAEAALAKLTRIIKTGNIPYHINKEKTLNIARDIYSHLMNIKYCYLPAQTIIQSQMIKDYEKRVHELADILRGFPLRKTTHKEELIMATIKWCLRILLDLKERLKLGEENKIENAIDVIAAEIVSLSKHPNSDKLKVTRVTTGAESYTLVTNIQDIKKGEVRAIAILLPIDLRGIISEAMFCSKPLDPTLKGKRPQSKDIDTKSINKEITKILSEMK